MADLEMDFDHMHPTSLEVPLDDDLINYESDAADYTILPDDDLGNETVPEAVQEAFSGTEPAGQGGEIIQGEYVGAQPSEATTEPAEPAKAEVTEQGNTIEPATETDLPLDADTADAAITALTGTVTDEIDYGLGDIDYHGDQNDGHENDGEESAAGVTEVALHEDAEVNPGAQDEKAEIGWEDDEAAEPVVAKVEKDEAESQEQYAIRLNTVQFGNAIEEPHVEEDDENRDYRQDELQGLEEALGGDASMATSPGLPDDDIKHHFPSITVQYQGDEFPFLSSGTEGFFSDASILDDSMQSVLSGFRSQLKNDLRAEDELVFQIDELGLEFTESNAASSPTMHQILEIFDLLVKNDDPDCTRTLYTYLFTRLNNAKRYEYLVESATSGKGLDEVQYLFPQQPSQSGSDVENENGSPMSSDKEAEEGHGEELADDILDDEAEEFAGENDEEYTQDNSEVPDEEYPEDHAQDNQEVEYFEEAAEQAGDTLHDDGSGATTAEEAEDVEPAEHDSFAHERSSTTSTLQGDTDGAALSADADDETAVDAEADGPVFVAEASEDAEIDWRDDDDDEVVGDGGSVTGKRSRDDNDEPDVDDELEFKRRRP